ncbi:hypothetical protein C3492_40920 [Streptomyces sp. Ru62]|uniref:hypothetical protein n=1 Tax=Streptomyces sp. Ru62 TaxID=2080745 RepID=UPI000CDE1106|nr:hypothetical protein [Streptomyces sp. Ru62]POX57913.1 hypothetical protein C3492_40920 [Streptomyces sp. Ru62]
MTVPPEVREHGEQARTSARTDGLVPALTLLVRALSPKAPPRGPRGHAVLPKELLEEFAAEEAATREAPGAPGTEGVEDAGPLPGLAVLRPVPGETSEPAPPAWGWALAWLRLGMSERLRDACLAHLAARQSEGTSLLLQQMVKGTLADVLLEHLEIEGVLDDLSTGRAGPLGPLWPADDERHLAGLQEQITRVDRALLRLLGAHGFTTEGPGAAAHASELLADAYGTAGPGTAREDA